MKEQSETRAQHLVRKRSEILEMIATGKPAYDVYDAIALMYEALHPGMRCSMLELKDNKLKHGGAPSLPKEYCDAVNGLEIGPNIGSCGTSTYTGKRVLVENIETDPKWSEIKQAALPHGMRCCWSEPVKDSSGKVLGAFGMYYNHPALPDKEESADLLSAAWLTSIVMERDQRETALRESKENYKELVEGTDNLITRVDKNGNFIYVNRASEKILGCSQENIIGKSALDFIHPDDQEKTQTRLEDCIKKKTASASIENRQINQVTGSISTLIWTTNFHYDKAGQLKTINGIAKDITKYKQLEKELGKVQKMESIGVLAGGIAHDFNNLLYIVTGNISLAQSVIEPEMGISAELEAAEKACFKAKELTSRLITFSKGGDPIKEMMPIDNLLKETVNSTLQGSDIHPQFFIDNDVRQAYIDENQIRQVIRNIVVNAKEAMSSKGHIKVTCSNRDILQQENQMLDQGRYIEIIIKDQGCGIPKEKLEKIFDPYVSTKEMGTGKGQGLGLAVCHSIVKKHGGLITVESELEKGSSFSIYLPAASSKTEAEGKSESQGEDIPVKSLKSPLTDKGKILLMDDEEMIRKFMDTALGRLGYEVETCIEGNKAIEIYTKAMESADPFDLAILDLTNKSGMGGQETMRRLLEIDPDVKGIIITGYFDDPVASNYSAYGFSGFLGKPSTRDELQKVINDVLLK